MLLILLMILCLLEGSYFTSLDLRFLMVIILLFQYHAGWISVLMLDS